MIKKYLISVDLGGTKILSALINDSNEIIRKIKKPTEAEKGKANIVKKIIQSIDTLISEEGIKIGQLKAIVVGVPGTVDPFTGIIAAAPNLGIKNYNIKTAIEKKISCPVLVENDVNLAGLGIKKYELDNQVKNMIVIFIGTGIGSSLFFEGNLYRGSSFYAGEIGHLQLICDIKKGKRITFEQAASRTAIVNCIIKDLRKNKRSVLQPLYKAKKQIKSKQLSLAVRDNDSLTKKYIDQSAYIIGAVIANSVTLLNVEYIILGGGVIEEMTEYMLPRIKKAFRENVLAEQGGKIKIISTKLGENSALLGGIVLFEEFIKG